MKKLLAILLTAMMVLALGACGSSSSGSSSSESAQGESDWPRSNVELIVPASPGGGTDITCRALMLALGKKGTFAAVNNTDGGGAAAFTTVATSDAKALNKLLYFHASYYVSYVTGITDLVPFEDLIPVWTADFAGSYFLVVANDSPFNSIDDIVQWYKDNPGEKLDVGVEIGNINQIMAGELATQLGVEFNYVSTGSDADRIPLIMGHNIDFAIINNLTTENYFPTGDIKAICALHGQFDNHSDKLKEVKTLEDSGYTSLHAKTPITIFVPKGTADADMVKINQMFEEALQDSEAQEALNKAGSILVSHGDLAGAQAECKATYEAIASVCKDLGMSVR